MGEEKVVNGWLKLNPNSIWMRERGEDPAVAVVLPFPA